MVKETEIENESSLLGKNTTLIFFLLVIVFSPLLLLVIVRLLYVAPSQPTIAGSDVSYPEGANEEEMINNINNYINQRYPTSPYKGMGKDFVEAGKQYGIHPGFVAAISVHESSMCTDRGSGCLCFPHSNSCFNSWGRKKSRDNPPCCGNKWTQYPSWKDGIYKHTEFLRRDYYDQGYTTVETIINRYAPPSENDTAGYIELMKTLPEKITGVPLKSNISGTARERAIQLAKDQLGKPYVLGQDVVPYQNHPPENPPTTFDCSKLTGWAYYWATNGKLNMPAYTLSQVSYCAQTIQIPPGSQSSGQEEPGDLVFFETCSSTNVNSNHHVGLIVERGKYIHAPHTGDVVKISDLSSRRNGYCICKIKPEYLE